MLSRCQRLTLQFAVAVTLGCHPASGVWGWLCIMQTCNICRDSNVYTRYVTTPTVTVSVPISSAPEAAAAASCQHMLAWPCSLQQAVTTHGL
jgi:hypothetical protein